MQTLEKTITGDNGEFPPSEEDFQLAEVLWNHFQMHHNPVLSDVIVVLGSNDMLPAERAADLYLDGWSRYPMVCTGGGGRFQGDCQITQARLLADTAIKMGVPENEIILENKAMNTGDNFKFTRELLKEHGINPRSIISVHMPSAERRDYYTCTKVWPEVQVTVASPRIPIREYHLRGFKGIPGQEFTQHRIISTLVANYQRCAIYAQEGFMTYQPDLFTPEVRHAYDELIERGFTKDMLKDKEGRIRAV